MSKNIKMLSLLFDAAIIFFIHILIQLTIWMIFIINDLYDQQLLLWLNATIILIALVYFFGVRKVLGSTPGQMLMKNISGN